MKPYPKYKATNISWLTEVPEDWNITRIKSICLEINKQNEKDEGNLLSVSQYTGVTEKRLNDNKVGMHEAESLVGYKMVEKDNLVMNIMLAWNGSLGVSNYDGIVSPAYSVFKFLNNNNPWYFHYLFRTQCIKNYFKAHSTGVVESRLRLYPDIFLSLSMIIPPLPVQSDIVLFLDSKVSVINKLIEAKQRQIELLLEKKRVVINDFLNQNLPDVSNKKNVPLKRLLAEPLQYGANESGEDYNENFPRYIRITDISHDGKLKSEGAKSLAITIAKPYLLEDGDILLARSGATAGKSFLYKKKYGICAFAGYLIKARIKQDVLLPEYLWYFTNSSYYKEWTNRIFIQATIQNISAEKYNYLEIPVCSINHQRHLVSELDIKCAKIDKLISNMQEEIVLFAEYKTRLINDVVTGKIDVSNIVSQEVAAENKQAKVIAFTPEQKTVHSKDNEDAVILATLVNAFGKEEHPFTKFDGQKFPYLLHRHIKGVAENYFKCAGGPYNKNLNKTAHPIALENHFIREHRSSYTGWVSDVNVQDAVKIFMEWYGDEPLKWMNQFRLIKNRKEELKLLTTVDYAMVEMRNKGQSITMQTVKDYINSSKEWRDKLKNPIFSDNNIERAIEWSNKLFGNQ